MPGSLYYDVCGAWQVCGSWYGGGSMAGSWHDEQQATTVS